MSSKLINELPAGAYLLDCSPYGPPKLLRVDPNDLSVEERERICRGISTFEVHPEFEIQQAPEQKFKVVPK